MYLTVRTDQPEARIYLVKEGEVIGSETWLADRQLSLQLLPKIRELLKKTGIETKDLEGIIFFSGPGSFTGLRIGASVANALAYSLDLPIIASQGNEWIADGEASVKNSPQKLITKLNYQSPPHITKPRK